MEKNPIEVSYSMVYKIKSNTGDFQNDLKLLNIYSWEDLALELDSDNKRKVFWINMYNFLTLKNLKDPLLRKVYPDSKFFSEICLELKNLRLCLDDIEHKILRHSKVKISLGYLDRWCVPLWEKSLRVEVLDYRIHFAINCGAASCPPICYYRLETLDSQLDTAMEGFIKSESRLEGKVLKTSKIFFWFKGDFGGSSGVIEINSKILKFDKKGIDLKYNEYDWTIKE